MIEKWQERWENNSLVPKYGIDTTPENAAEVWEALLASLGDVLHSADIDAYPGPESESFRGFSPEVADAYEALLMIAAEQRGDKRDWKMSVYVEVQRPDHMRVLQVFGPESINVDLFDGEVRAIGGMHDEGTSCWAALLDDERQRLLQELASKGLPESLVSPLPQRRRWFGFRHN